MEGPTEREKGSAGSALGGRRLAFARAAWVALAAAVLALDAAGIPYAYAHYKRVCTSAACDDVDRLTPDRLQALHDLGLSAGFFAAYDVSLMIVVTLVFAAVSAVIFWRGPKERMALFASFTLLVFGGAALSSGLPRALAAAHPALWVPVTLLYYLGQLGFIVFLYVFPDGRFVPRWTRWLAILWAALFVPNAFSPGSPVDLLNGPLFVVLIITTVVVQVYRYRRVSNPAQRQQTKWVVFGVAVAMVGFSGVITLANLVPGVERTGPLMQMLANALFQGLIALIPLSIGVAIVRSRLYDIDVLINRTLIYGALTVSLVAVYLGSVVLLQVVFRALTGESSQLAIVASTLAIAALFDPLRRRIQAFIDRRFFRRKYDARKTLEAFSAKLREETDLGELSGEVVAVVHETMQPIYVSLWLREGGRFGGAGGRR